MTHKFSSEIGFEQGYTNTVGYTFIPDKTDTLERVRMFTSQVGNNAAVTWTHTYDGNGNITKATASNRTEYRKR